MPATDSLQLMAPRWTFHTEILYKSRSSAYFTANNTPSITADPSAAVVVLDEVRGVCLEPRGVLVWCLADADPLVDNDLLLPNRRCADLTAN